MDTAQVEASEIPLGDAVSTKALLESVENIIF